MIQVVIFNLILNVYYECNNQETSLSVGIVLIEKDAWDDMLVFHLGANAEVTQ